MEARLPGKLPVQSHHIEGMLLSPGERRLLTEINIIGPKNLDGEYARKPRTSR